MALKISLNTAYAGRSAGLQWTLNAPQDDVISFTTTAGPAAVEAGKSLYCANKTCLLVGLNENAFANGVVAVVNLTLSPKASGNLVIQLSNPVEALLDGTGGEVVGLNGLVNVTAPVSVVISPATASLSSGQSVQFSASVAGESSSAVSWSIEPPVGTLVNGLYKAPSSITTPQTVVVTASSMADSTKSATALITLRPNPLDRPRRHPVR